MHILSGIVKCQICGGNYNNRLNNGQKELICSRKKNYGKKRCDSPTIKEQLLLDIISKHLTLENKEFELSKLRLYVKEIKISNEEIKILYRNGTYSYLSSDYYKV